MQGLLGTTVMDILLLADYFSFGKAVNKIFIIFTIIDCIYSLLYIHVVHVNAECQQSTNARSRFEGMPILGHHKKVPMQNCQIEPVRILLHATKSIQYAY